MKKVNLFLGVLAVAFVGSLYSCSNDEVLLENSEKQELDILKDKTGKLVDIDNKSDVISMFRSHHSVSRSLVGDDNMLSSYDLDKVVKIQSNDGLLYIYAVPSLDGQSCLMGYPSKDGKGITYFFKVYATSDKNFQISNELSEPMLDLTFNSSDNLFYVSGLYENDGLAIPGSRVATDSFICNVGMGVMGTACASAAGLTGGASLVFAACWSAATLFVCP